MDGGALGIKEDLPSRCDLLYPIGRVQKIAVGKKQAYYQPPVSTGKLPPDRLMVLGWCTHRLVISGFSLVPYLSGQTLRCQRRQVPAIYL